ncbi:MAG: hypothetical protein ACPGVG_15740 [Mycobacterium sp.]
MAASAVHTATYQIPGARKVNEGYLTFDSDATVELSTNLSVLTSATFTKQGSGGSANVLSVDETWSNGVVDVVGGFITVDAAGSTTDVWAYRLEGH